MKVYQPEGYDWAETRLARFIERNGCVSLEDLYARAARDPERFWDSVVAEIGIDWKRSYYQTLDLSNGVMWPRWFVGGELDLVDNLVGRHARAEPGKIALRWEGDGGEVRCLTYAQLSDQVAQAASGFEALGIGPGDRVALYLPMIPEAAVMMLAATRLGAVFIPFFSGYGADSVAQRMRDCEAKLLVCANGYARRGKRVVMLDDARRAAAQCPSVRHLVVVDLVGDGTPAPAVADVAGNVAEIDYRVLLAAGQPLAGESASGAIRRADDPLMLIYTSGTTGKPKAVVHTHGGFPIKAAQDLIMAFDLHADDTLMWVTDMGWLMGPWMVYGGLLLGATIMLFEGTADYPDPGRLWRVVEGHGVTHLGLSPSLARILMGKPGSVPEPRQLERLRLFGSTGEAWNEVPWLWLFETVGRSRRPIINYSGGTEIGGGILACFPGLPQKPGAFSGPIPGMCAEVVDADGVALRGSVGELVIGRPWPGMTRGFWHDDARYEETYWSRYPGLWHHGDWARVDGDGFWFVHGRSDDTIKVAGKRVGPNDFESALVAHPLVAEALAIGVPDEIKGEAVVCFVTVREASMLDGRTWDEWQRDLVELVGSALGKPLRPAHVHRVAQMPKTRNGKLLRRVARAAYLGTRLGDLSSLENPAAIEEIAAIGVVA